MNGICRRVATKIHISRRFQVPCTTKRSDITTSVNVDLEMSQILTPGVPQISVNNCSLSSSMIRDRPKSAIIISASSAFVRNNKFSGFKSSIIQTLEWHQWHEQWEHYLYVQYRNRGYNRRHAWLSWPIPLHNCERRHQHWITDKIARVHVKKTSCAEVRRQENKRRFWLVKH